MPTAVTFALKLIGGILASLATSLITKKFLRTLIITLLEKLVKKTDTDADDKILQAAKEEWEKSDG